jgi:cyclohexanone monooxygenase
LTGKRVGVIGTGSSGTQLIPLVAEQVGELVIFQRTANFCMPARNHPLDPAAEREWKAHYGERRAHARRSSFGHNQLSNDVPGATVSAADRQAEFGRRWQLGGLYMLRAFSDILTPGFRS